MFKYIDYSLWNLYDGFSEGSGRSEKNWLQSTDGTIGLFKYPKIDPVTNTTTYEHVSEHLAHELGNILDVRTAKVELGIYHGRKGSMSYLVNGKNEELREGGWFVLGKYPRYDPDRMIDVASGEYYSVNHILGISTDEILRKFWIEMMFFDFVIGNRDRHQNNWAFLMPIEDRDKKVIRIRPCPLYDNGSSLCCYITESLIDNYLGKDMTRFGALIDSKSKSVIRIDGKKKSMPCHSDMIRHLMSYASKISFDVADRFIAALTEDKINTLIYEYPEEIISSKRKSLLIKYLNGKMSILKNIRLEN